MTPEQWYIIAAAIGAFAAREAWPWLRGLVDAEFKARRAREQATIKRLSAARTAQEEVDAARYLAAFEANAAANKATAAALGSLAASIEGIQVAIDMFARSSVSQQFETQAFRATMEKGFERLERLIAPATTEHVR